MRKTTNERFVASERLGLVGGPCPPCPPDTKRRIVDEWLAVMLALPPVSPRADLERERQEREGGGA